MPTLTLGDNTISEASPAYIIAEIGINHQGDVKIARELIYEAAHAGADAVKFQKRNVDRILTREGLEMPYENPNSFGKTYGEHKRALELSEADYRELLSFANEMNVDFAASGWDEESADFLDELPVAFFKMASADLTNLPLLAHTAQKGKPIILSTGMANLDMVKQAVALVKKYTDQVAILQCTSTYPSKFDEINLRVMDMYRKTFPGMVIGYSGHELGIAISEAAVALGAKIVERHFTLDRTMKGGDHAASLEPGGLSKLIRDIRHIEESLGNGEKVIQASEKPYIRKLTKSVVSTIAIPKGSRITREMLITKGPGTGISPARIEELVGKTAKNDLQVDVVIREEDIEW
ncbi:MAG: N-acetylneuraminate synthase family protein [Candidatus Marinimicrobia bacterium]|nr:N-acetylneuraminate synthase family protein [Candidatus Neomarinimicrobiota bacterium]MCF7840259.1 N-acetylneuraminate synthase family protein [Candidatus Neomarinimicrobiota bacterium]MCF7902620.1 N-acetylneuraminate synthase family protein [Candidatus Neomarinimicrobiota bacterium]